MLLVFHFEISGNSINDIHIKNNPLILLTLLIFHIDISGNNFNDIQ